MKVSKLKHNIAIKAQWLLLPSEIDKYELS